MNGPEPAGHTTVAPKIVTGDTGKMLDFLVETCSCPVYDTTDRQRGISGILRRR